jgi:hypothetical protein
MKARDQRHYGVEARNPVPWRFAGLILTVLCMIFVGVAALTPQEVDPNAGARPLDPATFRAVAALFRYDQSIPLDARVLDRMESG